MSDKDLDFLKQTKEEPTEALSTEELFMRVLNTLGAFEGRLQTLEDHVAFLLSHSPEYEKVLEAYEKTKKE